LLGAIERESGVVGVRPNLLPIVDHVVGLSGRWQQPDRNSLRTLLTHANQAVDHRVEAVFLKSGNAMVTKMVTVAKKRPAGVGWPSRKYLILWIGAEEGT